MYYYVNINPPVETSIVSVMAASSFARPRHSMGEMRAPTRFVGDDDQAFDLFAVAKGARAPTAEPLTVQYPDAGVTKTIGEPAAGQSFSREKAAESLIADKRAVVEKIANQRVKLMAAKYAGGETYAEVVARLEILNRRLLEYSPRVSHEQVSALELAHEQLNRIRAAREDRARRLDLSL